MHTVPKMPSEKVMDLLDLFQEERDRWRMIPDRGTEYNDSGTLKHRFYWLEYCDLTPGKVPTDPKVVMDSVRVYRVPEDLRHRIVAAKALEKALELAGVTL